MISERAGARSARQALIGIAVFTSFFLVGLAAYFNAFRVPFLGDDIARILVDLPRFHRLGFWATLRNVTPDRPFLTFTNWLDYSLFGANVVAFKATSLAIHCLSGYALYRLLRRISKDYLPQGDSRSLAWTSLFLSWLFVAHPAFNQALNINIQRGALLSVGFGICSFSFFMAHIRHHRRSDYLIAVLAFLLAVTSKPSLITLPLIFYLFGRLFETSLTQRSLAAKVSPFLVMAALPAIYHFGLEINPQFARPWYDYLSIQTRVVWVYFRLFLVPTHLHYLYDIDLTPNLFRNLTFVAILGHLGVLFYATRILRKRRLLAFSIFATYLALVPESSGFPIFHVIFEHRVLAPFVFIFIGVFAVSAQLFERGRHYLNFGLIAAVPLMAAGSVARSYEIDTFEKWVRNTLQYSSNDFMFNVRILSILHEQRKMSAGKEFSAFLKSRHPDEVVYDIYDRVFRYDELTADERKEALERIGNALIFLPLEDQGREFLNHFVIQHITEFADRARADSLLEKLLTPQVPLFLVSPVLAEYHRVLSSLRSHYESEIRAGHRLNGEELAQYRLALRNLDLYYKEKLTEIPQ